MRPVKKKNVVRFRRGGKVFVIKLVFFFKYNILEILKSRRKIDDRSPERFANNYL